MLCADGCDPEVHEKALLPCWHTHPADRPGYATIMDTLVDLGAVPPDTHHVADVVTRSHAEVAARRSTLDFDRGLLGPSVYHIQHVFAPNVYAAVLPPWKDLMSGIEVDPPESATISQAVSAVVKPASAEKMCPRDGGKGAAYVDTLDSKNDVGRATALLSCTCPSLVL
jgi:hypothetical protein